MCILRNNGEWRVYPEELANRHSDGLAAVRSALKELEDAGYIRTYCKSKGRGMGKEYHRFCSDTKISEWIFEQLCKKVDELQD